MENNNLKSQPTLENFVTYCAMHPELRFWQALQAWSSIAHIVAMSEFDYEMFNHDYLKKNNIKMKDTYYFE